MKRLMGMVMVMIALALAPFPAFAETITPAQARGNIGRIVTVEGVVSGVHLTATGAATYIYMGGRYPDNDFTAIIFRDDAGKFAPLGALEEKVIAVTGPITIDTGKPAIILKDPGWLKIK